MAYELERRQERETQTLGRRLDQALRKTHLLAGAPGTTLGDRISTSGKSRGAPPPPSDQLLNGDGTVFDHYARRLRLMIRALEREVDAHEVRPIEAELGRESMEDKQERLIRDYVGIPSFEVSFLDTSMGSPRTVERTRVKCGVDPRNGTPLHEVLGREAA